MKAFHEITGTFSNPTAGVTDRNFTDQTEITPAQVLQKWPEITRNTSHVIDPTRYGSAPEQAPSGADIYREKVSLDTSHPNVDEDLVSRRTAMGRRERLRRLKSEIKARQPYTCPHCGSGALLPSFATDRRATWICADCDREFCVAD